MKSRKESPTGKFQSFDIIITVESEAEARGLHAIFNYCPNVDVLPESETENLRDLLEEYEIINSEDEIANGVTYSEFYRSKKPATK